MKDLLSFYKEYLNKEMLPFWISSLDDKYGGVYTCYNNEGSTLLSKDKYTWSQGRMIWVLSRLALLCREGVIEGDAILYEQHAAKSVRFLLDHVFLENGNCAFLLSESGEKKESILGQGYDTSFYADCFVVLGFTEYSRLSQDEGILHQAVQLYDRISERLQSGNVRSEPYPIPEGVKAHAVSMIMLNVTQELADAAESLNHSESSRLRKMSLFYLEEIMGTFCQADGSIAEMIPSDSRLQDTVLCRHLAPGHTLECMWFAMTEARKLGRKDIVEQGALVVKRAFSLGWDAEYGGLFRYVDRDGGEPKGSRSGHGYETLVSETWDMKIWWPHSEALYSLLFAYDCTQDDQFMAYYEQMHQYVFETFPNSNKQIGEWIQIRNRQGEPIQKLVALPLKDPYHILRNIILIIELLNRNKEEKNLHE